MFLGIDLHIWYAIGAGVILLLLLPFAVAFLRSRRKDPSFSAIVRGQFEYIDQMDGIQFEHFIASLLERLGYDGVDVTAGSHDQGVDVLAERDGVRFAFQCKNYDSNLGNTAVQEVVAGREYYHCHVGVVVTNSYFTDSAAELAAANRVILWDREHLARLIEQLDL